MLIKKDQDVIRGYFEDSSNLKGGHADSVAFPEDITALSEFVKEANQNKLPITISGGGTGTTGSRIPFGGIVVSLEKFNKIIEISEGGFRAIVQAGVLVEDFKNECERKGLFYACYPTEKTAFLGGTIATNASGSRSFKYGSTRIYVERLKMVLASGEIYEIKRGQNLLTKKYSTIRLDSGQEIKIPLPAYKMPKVKNSAGYFARTGMDAIDLFIGQEGTLSIIVEMELGLTKKPPKIFSSFVFFKEYSDSWNFAAEARTLSKDKNKADGIDALSIEYFDENALKLLRQKNSAVPKDASAAIFFEQEAAGADEERSVDSWLKLISKHNAFLDNTWVAMTEKMRETFTQFRHAIPESINEIVKRNGFRKLSTDIAVPESKFLDMMRCYAGALKRAGIEHAVFGHIGECHVHVNLLPRDEKELKISEEICLKFVKKAVALGGTVSAEHGIGKTRREYLEEMYGHEGILEMARIKKALDPNCVLGLDNIFPKEALGLV